MPSVAYRRWAVERAGRLDAVERAHTAIRATGPGRREAARQLNHAYTLLLAAEFQGFCRELHTEAVTALAAALPARMAVVVEAEFVWNRQLDRGNATPSALGSDFGRLGFDLWPAVDRVNPNGPRLRRRLDELNAWRNAVAHSDFDPARLGGTILLRLARVRHWRRACRRVARLVDRVVADELTPVTGTCPW